MYRLGFSIAVLIFSILGISAQNNIDAEKVINKLLTSVKTTAVKTNFQLSVTEKNAVTSQPISGTFTMKATKFLLEMNDTKVWFDGKTQWAYSTSDNEVSITEPSEDELATINPMAILSGFKAKSNVKFSKIKSMQNHIIELTPKDKKNDFIKIEVQINKTNNNLILIKLMDKKGTITILNLTNYKQANKVAEETFQFNKSKFKGVTINDLR
jgi:outer membrane lipoprotein-sorting protein